MKKLVWMVAIPLFAGCDAGHLEDIEIAARQYQQCLVHQVMPEGCDDAEKAMNIAELRGRQKGIDEAKLDASREIGTRLVDGNPSESPYHRIRRSLTQKPFYIEPEAANFRPYQDKCLDIDLEAENPSPEDMERFIEWWAERSDFRLQVIAYVQRGNTVNFLLSRSRQPCLPDDYSKIDEEFPLLTESQAAKLGDGEYLKGKLIPGYSSANVEIFKSFEEAKARYDELAGDESK